MRLRCPHCQRTLEVPDSAAGKQVRCPACSNTTRAPEQTPGEAPRPPGGEDAADERKPLYASPPASSPLSPQTPSEPDSQPEAGALEETLSQQEDGAHQDSTQPQGSTPKENRERTACPRCGKMLLVTAALANQIVACPACHSRMRMPSLGDAGRGVPAKLAFGVGSGTEAKRAVPTLPDKTGRPSAEGTAPASWASSDWKQASWRPGAPLGGAGANQTPGAGANPYIDPNSAVAQDPHTTPVGTAAGPYAVGGSYVAPASGHSEPILYILPGAFQLTFALLTLVITIIATVGSIIEAVDGNNPDVALTLLFQAISLLTTSVIVAGSIQMIRRQSLGLARAAAILSILPCNTCCVGLIPFGIWSTIMLFLPNAPNDFR